MNVPRNISIFTLIVCFVIGGAFSIITSLLLFDTFSDIIFASFLAPVAEEPGKLLISLLILTWLNSSKQKTIYGMTGLTIGAAVGAEFAAFETAQYIIMNDNPLMLLAARSLFSLSSHVMYCAPYVTVAALLMQKKPITWNVVKENRFLKIFLLSCGLHALWNFTASYLGNLIWAVFAIELILQWKLTLTLIRECFQQIVSGVVPTQPYNTSAAYSSKPLSTVSSVIDSSHTSFVNHNEWKINCINGVYAGKAFVLNQPNFAIGTSSSCHMIYPTNTFGISQIHCKFVQQNGGLYLADMGSQNGTYLNGTKLQPSLGKLLKKGDMITLGSENEKYIIE